MDARPIVDNMKINEHEILPVWTTQKTKGIDNLADEDQIKREFVQESKKKPK